MRKTKPTEAEIKVGCKERIATLCSWCKSGITSKEKNSITSCSKDKWEPRKGFNQYPDLTECDQYTPDIDPAHPDFFFIDLMWWPTAWAAAEVDRLQIKLSTMRLLDENKTERPL